jgi:hypothetical protein
LGKSRGIFGEYKRFVTSGGCGCVRMYTGQIMFRTVVTAATANKITDIPVPE